ncbi:MAG TPA: hypothetical protein VL551_19045 [Actinospica sp.]|jgi:hypothetical protein|nr:hypothetical protein [Actinospica sp.]
MSKRQLPDFPLWHGVPRVVPPPFGPARLPLVPAEPPAATLTRAPVAAHSPAPAPPRQPYQQRPQLYVVPTPPRRVPLRFVRTLALAALAVVTAAATYTVLHRDDAPQSAPVDPFSQAVSALANTPVIHYVTSTADIYVTSDGEEIGTTTRDGQRVDILVVGSAMYFEPAGYRNDWTPTPNDLDTPTPGALAAQIRSALPGARRQTTSLNGVHAVVAATKSGAVYVSATAPYRVLRVDSLTLEPMTAAEDKQVYDQVVRDVREVAGG